MKPAWIVALSKRKWTAFIGLSFSAFSTKGSHQIVAHAKKEWLTMSISYTFILDEGWNGEFFAMLSLVLVEHASLLHSNRCLTESRRGSIIQMAGEEWRSHASWSAEFLFMIRPREDQCRVDSSKLQRSLSSEILEASTFSHLLQSTVSSFDLKIAK